MTLGQLIECLCGKLASTLGTEIDGSGFSNFDLNDIKAQLKALGFREDGTEYMRNGFTGKKMKIPIFIGPTYYQRLKHMVADKVHSRARGPSTILTRQPPEGRSKDGGLRMGEISTFCLKQRTDSKGFRAPYYENSVSLNKNIIR